MEFLDSEAFEKMAREYQLKYQSISILGTSSFDKKALSEIFSDIHTLFHFFNKNINSKDFDELANQLYEKMDTLKKELELQNYLQKSEIKSNKQAIKMTFKVLFMLLEQENPTNFEKFYEIYKLLLKATMYYFSGF